MDPQIQIPRWITRMRLEKCLTEMTCLVANRERILDVFKKAQIRNSC